jgi:hypothetical protein
VQIEGKMQLGIDAEMFPSKSPKDIPVLRYCCSRVYLLCGCDAAVCCACCAVARGGGVFFTVMVELCVFGRGLCCSSDGRFLFVWTIETVPDTTNEEDAEKDEMEKAKAAKMVRGLGKEGQNCNCACVQRRVHVSFEP